MSKYVTLEEYTTLYGEITEQQFNRLVMNASARADRLTTGVDGLHKLKEYFPEDSEDAEVVKSSICGVIHLMAQVETLEESGIASQGYIAREDGTQVGKIITSVSSGSESISYSASGGGQTTANKLIGDYTAQNEAYNLILQEGFRGIKDSNGVNLMYMGAYPRLE